MFWASVECGLVLPSISAWEVVGKEKFKSAGGYITWWLAMAGAGHQVGAAQGGRHQGPPESEGPQEGLAVPGGFTAGRMVGEQGGHIRHGQCPILLGTPGSPSTQGPLRTLPSSGLELRLCG